MNHRENGAVGAILDEYERAINSIKEVISNISDEELTTIVDPKTTDADCRSIQTILSHVVRSGYAYAILVRKKLGEEISFIERQSLNTSNDYAKSLDIMFHFNVQLFRDYSQLTMDAFQGADHIHSTWGTKYDLEQIYEHAIVHVLRHRRQIERFKMKIKGK